MSSELNNNFNSAFDNAMKASQNMLDGGLGSPHRSTNTVFKSSKLSKGSEHAGHKDSSPIYYFFYDISTPGNLYHDKSVIADSRIELVPGVMVLQFHNKHYHEINRHLATGELINKDCENNTEDEFKIKTMTRMGTSVDKANQTLNESSNVVFGGVKIIGLTHNPLTGLMRVVYSYKHYSVDNVQYDHKGEKQGHLRSKFDMNRNATPAGEIDKV